MAAPLAGGRAYLAVVTSIVIPAHNEAGVIGRLLRQMTSDANPGEFDVIVVANGCTDETAEVAAKFGPAVRVLSIPVPSKHAALTAGDQVASDFPRIYLDADVELHSSDLRALGEALQRPGVLAVAPRRELALTGRPWLVRWYYDVWTQLPEVREGLFGRGVIGVSALGHARMADLPPVLADDLAASLAFTPEERYIVPNARVLIHPPRTFGDLLRRRVRAVVSVAQIENNGAGKNGTEKNEAARTRPADLLAIARGGHGMAPRVTAFVLIAVVARLRARRTLARRDYSTWLRDESSRQ
jgi:glycosyltransferase involved in cell wall biosynthesis